MKNWSIAVLLIVIFAVFYLPLNVFLESELVSAKEHPKFGLSGADVGGLKKAVAELEESIDAVSEMYGDPAQKKLVRTALHPISFLKSLSKLEDWRRAFIKYPSLANLLNYKWRRYRTTALYESDLRKYQNTLKSLGAEENETYHFGPNAISLKTLLANVDFMLKNAALLKKYSNPEESSAPAHLAVKPPILSDEEKRDAEFTRKLIQRLDWEILMPLVEVESDCGKPDERDLFYLVRREEFLVPMSIRPVYFHFEKTRFKNSEFYKTLREAGFEYSWQPDFNFYFCPDLSYQPEILTLYRIQELLKSGKENQNISEEIQRLQIEKSGYFEKLVLYGARLNRNLPRLIKRLEKPLAEVMPIKELFITRSYPSLYFLPFNRSVWLLDTPLDFGEYSQDSKFHDNYSKLLERYSEEELFELAGISIDPSFADKAE